MTDVLNKHISRIVVSARGDTNLLAHRYRLRPGCHTTYCPKNSGDYNSNNENFSCKDYYYFPRILL